MLAYSPCSQGGGVGTHRRKHLSCGKALYMAKGFLKAKVLHNLSMPLGKVSRLQKG